MRRLTFVLFAALCVFPALYAQEAASPKSPQSPTAQPEPGSTTETAKRGGGEVKEPGDEDKWVIWKWVNFAILAGGLVYLLRKPMGAFLAGRTEAIRRDIDEAGRLRQEAEERAKEIEKRLSALAQEIENIRTEVRAEFAHDGERIRKETERHVARIQHQAEQEIASIARAATNDLRAQAARLALDLAERRIGERMDHNTQDRLFRGFLASLDKESRS
ncbi:MAG TPA: ATP synthase F0 subunit B [Bryobacteraceae bacterium]|nr:ATP synthase F0 subunit B [Bryobacteraceae bacterium]